MMKQLLFELRKISLSKLTVAIVLVLLLVTGGLAYNQASKAPESQQTRQYEKKISAVISNAKRQYQQIETPIPQAAPAPDNFQT